MEDTAQRDRSRRQFRPSILVEKQLPNGKGVGAEEKRGILSEFILCDFHLSRGLQPNVETSYDSPPLWFLFPRSSRSLSLSLSLPLSPNGAGPLLKIRALSNLSSVLELLAEATSFFTVDRLRNESVRATGTLRTLAIRCSTRLSANEYKWGCLRLNICLHGLIGKSFYR